MKTIPLCLCLLAALLVTPASAEPPTTGLTATQAYAVAKQGVDPSMQSKVVSIYGTGIPAAIQTWYVIFYDPSVPSHGHAIRVDSNGQITKSYEAKGGVVYSDALTFDPGMITNEGPALTATQNYAAQHAIAYDHVRALLRQTQAGPTLRWRVEMMNGAANKGFVFVNAADGTFAMYSPPGTVHGTTTGNGGVVGDAEHFGNQVKNTFLGIGGDLEEFFTGERTVDR